MTEVYREKVRLLSEQKIGNSYGITLPDALLDMRFTEDDYIRVSLNTTEVYGKEITFITGTPWSRNKGDEYRKIQGGTSNHPTLKIGFPIDWTRDNKGNGIDLNKNDDIIVELENEVIRVYKQEDYSLISEPGASPRAIDESSREKYLDWVEKGKPTQTFRLVPIDGFNKVFTENIDEESLPAIGSFSLIGPEEFEDIKSTYDIPITKIDAISIKWNPNADFSRGINISDSGDYIHLEKNPNAFIFDFPKRGMFEIIGHQLSGTHIEDHASVERRTWLAHLPTEGNRIPYEINTVTKNWVTPYFDSNKAGEIPTAYLIPWNDKTSDEIEIDWHYYWPWGPGVEGFRDFPHLFKDV